MTGSDQHDVARDRDPESLTERCGARAPPLVPSSAGSGSCQRFRQRSSGSRTGATTEEGIEGQVTVAVDVDADPERESSRPQSDQER